MTHKKKKSFKNIFTRELKSEERIKSEGVKNFINIYHHVIKLRFVKLSKNDE